MRHRILLTFATLVVVASTLTAHDPDDLLKRLINSSESILVVDIIDDPSTDEDSVNVITYNLECKVKGVCKGQIKLNAIINVLIQRTEEVHKKDRPRLLRKGATCVVFLRDRPKGSVPALISTEHWFSVQAATPTLIKNIESFVKRSIGADEQKAKSKERKRGRD